MRFVLFQRHIQAASRDRQIHLELHLRNDHDQLLDVLGIASSDWYPMARSQAPVLSLQQVRRWFPPRQHKSSPSHLSALPQSVFAFLQSWAQQSFSAELQSPWRRNHAAPLPCWPDFSGVCSWMTQSDRAFRHLEPSDMCTWMQRLCQHLRNKNDEEQPIRHKEDLPTTETDTYFIAVHREM